MNRDCDAPFGKFLETTTEAVQEILGTDFLGTLLCCQVGLADVLDFGWGRIVLISSSGAQRGSPYMAHYAASEGAVITLIKSLAAEYPRKGVTVDDVAPSRIDTPMARQSQSAGTLGSPEQLAKPASSPGRSLVSTVER